VQRRSVRLETCDAVSNTATGSLPAIVAGWRLGPAHEHRSFATLMRTAV